MSFERKNALRRAEPSERAVWRRVGGYSSTLDAHVRTRVWTSSVNCSAREDYGRECAVCSAIDGEIDLVARKRNLIAFVEVKARASLDDAAWAVTPRQQQRIINAAQAWLMAHPEHAEFEMRFDAMLIAPRSLPRHLLAAFDASP